MVGACFLLVVLAAKYIQTYGHFAYDAFPFGLDLADGYPSLSKKTRRTVALGPPFSSGQTASRGMHIMVGACPLHQVE